MSKLKSETLMKREMQSYIDQFGLKRNIDTTLEDGTRVYIIAPNRFGPGFIYVFKPEARNIRWAANFSQKTPGKLCTPKRENI